MYVSAFSVQSSVSGERARACDESLHQAASKRICLLQELFKEKVYNDLQGGILEGFGRLLKHDLKIYVCKSHCNLDSKIYLLSLFTTG